MKRRAEDFLHVVLQDVEWTLSLIESISDGILIADSDGIVQFVNEGYLTVTGLKREQILGKRLSGVRPGALLPQAIASGESKVAVYRREEDTEYVVDVAPIRHKGVVIGGVGVIKDIRQILILSKELEKHVKRNRELRSVVNRAYQARYQFKDIIGNSPKIQDTILLAKRQARFEADVLITGESGTGKEMFAQAIHNASSRADMPFIPINCATLNSSLLESELFGYEEGAFTGARKGGKVGLFAVANGGTVMLDEIAELSYDLQAKLLRVLQERTVRKVGENAEHPIDIRVVAATNKNLLDLTKQGRFREDLYYRLNAMSLELPSLRDREGDIGLLAEFFLAQWSQRNGQYFTFHLTALEKMAQYHWPGNIRELKNVIEFSAYSCDRDIITQIYLPKVAALPEVANELTIPVHGSGSLKKIIADTERLVIQSMLKECGDNLEAKKQVATQLGISLSTLYNKSR